MAPDNKIKVPIVKAGKEAFLEVDTTAIPDDMYALAMLEGLKVLLNARMSKVGAVTKLAGDELTKAQSKAMEIAQDNLAKLNAGDVKGKSSKAKSDIPREVLTEARRIGRELAKNEIRKAGLKPSHVPASEITKAADAMIAQDPSILAQAQANIASRGNLTSEIDLGKFVDIGAAKAKDDAAKTKAKATKGAAPLSATQAGIVAKRKPQVATGAIH